MDNRLSDVTDSDLILEQSKLLDEEIPKLVGQYLGKVIAFYDDKILAVGETEDEVINKLKTDNIDLGLPIIIRRIVKPEFMDLYMGGPKGFE